SAADYLREQRGSKLRQELRFISLRTLLKTEFPFDFPICNTSQTRGSPAARLIALGRASSSHWWRGGFIYHRFSPAATSGCQRSVAGGCPDCGKNLCAMTMCHTNVDSLSGLGKAHRSPRYPRGSFLAGALFAPCENSRPDACCPRRVMQVLDARAMSRPRSSMTSHSIRPSILPA